MLLRLTSVSTALDVAALPTTSSHHGFADNSSSSFLLQNAKPVFSILLIRIVYLVV
jgi:hypothetical protein